MTRSKRRGRGWTRFDNAHTEESARTDSKEAHQMLWMATGEEAAAVDLVKRFHYSKRAPNMVQLVVTWHEAGGLFGDFGDAVAAVFWSWPVAPWSEPVWELSRLVRVQRCTVPLTGLIARACDAIPHYAPRVVVSFADPTHGHHGGIYQAASWKYGGQRKASVDGLIVNGTYVPRRTCWDYWGTSSVPALRARGMSVEAHLDYGKHLYWRALDASGKAQAKRMNLASLPYPKPDQGAL